MDSVGFVRVKAGHPHPRELLPVHGFCLPPIENSLFLVLSAIHEGGHIFAFIRRHESVYVAELNNRTDFLVFGDCIAAYFLLPVSHVLRLDFHTETAAHGNVYAEFQGGHAVGLMVRYGTDVGSHRNSREEIGCSPLHVDSLKGIGVVAYPEFIEPRHDSPVGTSAS